MTNYNNMLQSFNICKSWTLRPGQISALDHIRTSAKPVNVICSPTGCHHRSQNVLMYDGSIENITKIAVGDKLMGPDGEPRIVELLHHGTDQMYRIVPIKGASFIVNSSHYLSLKRTNISNKYSMNSKSGNIIDIRVVDYFKLSKNQRNLYKLFRVQIDFNKKQQILDPYFLGLLLGDGILSHGNAGISNMESEVHNEIYYQAFKHGLKIRTREDGKTFYFTTGILGGDPKTRKKNTILEKIKELGLYKSSSHNKFIPSIYKIANLSQRLELLAGLMDSDGSYSPGGYDYISKSKQLAEDIAYVCRSVGLAAYISKQEKYSQNGNGGWYYRVSISGNCNIIPCRVERKKAKKRKQKKDVLVTGFKIEPFGIDEYFGVTVSGGDGLFGDGRYLLDDFTVTHNSGKSLIGLLAGSMSRSSCTYLCSSKYLQDQISREFQEVATLKGRANYSCAYNPRFTAAECVFSNKNKCPEKNNCAYEQAKHDALSSRYRILNYHYFISEANFVGRFSKQHLVICDEADKLEDILSNYASLIFTDRMVELVSGAGNMPRYKTADREHKLLEWRRWADMMIPLADRKLAVEEIKLKEDPDPDIFQIRVVQSLSTLVDRLKIFLQYVDSSWIYECREHKSGRTHKFTPTWLPPEFTDRYFWRHSDRFICMSGTFPPVRILSKIWGLGFDKMDFIEISATFPSKNRMTYLVEDAPDMSYKNFESNKIELARLVNKILSMHPNERGIIHTHSWKLNDTIMSMNNNRLITHNSTDKDEKLNLFFKTPHAVFVSPSSMRGLDLHDDLCRFIIICKMPYQSLKDKLVSARIHGSTVGRSWYVSSAIQEIVQAGGRGVRHEKDWAYTYIIDNNAINTIIHNRAMVPRYYMDAVELRGLT